MVGVSRKSSILIHMASFDRFWHKTLRQPYKLHASFHGDPSKPTIVLLHGIGASGDDWGPFVQNLTLDYYCVTIDLLGFGKSPKPTWCEYDIDDQVQSLHNTLQKLSLGGNYILMGHSLGSLISVRYVRLYARDVSRLIMLNPPVYPALGSIKNGGAKALTGLLLKLYQFIRSEKMTPALFDKISRVLPIPRDIIEDHAIWLPFMKTLEHCIEQQDVLGDVAAIHTKTDVWYGSFDEFVIGSNVELLAANPSVSLHKFLGDHQLTNSYAKLVCKSLKQPTKL